jgi:hypothetical protein
MYTVVYLYPHSDRVEPTREFLLALVSFFGGNVVEFVSATQRPALWDVDHYEPVRGTEDGGGIWISTTPKDDVDKRDVPVAQALELWQSRKFRLVRMRLPYLSTAKQIVQDVEARIPATVRGAHVSWDISITCGPWSEPDWTHKATAASGELRISISGDQYPSNPAEYLRLFRELPSVAQLQNWLKQQTGGDWDIGLSLT